MKAGKQLNELGRLANILNTEDKYVVFECFILSHFNHCSVELFCCNILEINELENFQKRALRYVLNSILHHIEN